MSTTPISGEGVLIPGFMACVTHVTSAVPRLVSLEVVEALRPVIRQRSGVTMMRIIAVVHMAVKAVGAVKPGTSSEKHPVHKPIGPVIAVRSTVIWGIVEVPVRAHGSRSDVDADGNLGRRHRGAAQKGSNESCESKRADFEHAFLLDAYRIFNLDS